jgi:ABC-2 type transport system permease protein
MGKVLILTRREVATYFVSPVAYVAMALFLCLSGVFFAMADFRPGAPAAMRSIFEVMTIVLIFIVPLVTMRALSEERRLGTLESLLTAPVTDTQVVVAKFLGCWLFYLAMLAPTALYVVALAMFGRPDYGPIASGYIGMALMGGMYVSIGLLASSMTSSQVISAITSVIALFSLALVFWWVAPMVPQPYRRILMEASVRTHYADFSQGVVDVVHIIYFIAVTVYALFFTVKVLESRRWR